MPDLFGVHEPYIWRRCASLIVERRPITTEYADCVDAEVMLRQPLPKPLPVAVSSVKQVHQRRSYSNLRSHLC